SSDVCSADLRGGRPPDRCGAAPPTAGKGWTLQHRCRQGVRGPGGAPPAAAPAPGSEPDGQACGRTPPWPGRAVPARLILFSILRGCGEVCRDQECMNMKNSSNQEERK